MYIYTFGPIDHWEGNWHQIDEFVRLNPDLGFDVISLAMESGAIAAKCSVRSMAWDGDIRNEHLYAARCSHFRYDDGHEVAMEESVIVGWKQDNNGMSFIASIFPIDRLERMEQVEGLVGRIHPPVSASQSARAPKSMVT